MIEVHKTFTTVTHWVTNWYGIRELKVKIVEGRIWRCNKCGEYFLNRTEARKHKHET